VIGVSRGIVKYTQTHRFFSLVSSAAVYLMDYCGIMEGMRIQEL